MNKFFESTNRLNELFRKMDVAMKPLQLATVIPTTHSIDISKFESPNLASHFVKCIEDEVKVKESKLTESQTLVVQFISQTGERIIASTFGYHNPHIVFIHGFSLSNEQECTVLTHMNAVQLIFVIVEVDDRSLKRRYGFVFNETDSGSDDK